MKKHQQRQPESAEPHGWKHAENDKGTIDAGIEQQQEEIFVSPAAPMVPRVPRLQDADLACTNYPHENGEPAFETGETPWIPRWA